MVHDCGGNQLGFWNDGTTARRAGRRRIVAEERPRDEEVIVLDVRGRLDGELARIRSEVDAERRELLRAAEVEAAREAALEADRELAAARAYATRMREQADEERARVAREAAERAREILDAAVAAAGRLRAGAQDEADEQRAALDELRAALHAARDALADEAATAERERVALLHDTEELCEQFLEEADAEYAAIVERAEHTAAARAGEIVAAARAEAASVAAEIVAEAQAEAERTIASARGKAEQVARKTVAAARERAQALVDDAAARAEEATEAILRAADRDAARARAEATAEAERRVAGATARARQLEAAAAEHRARGGPRDHLGESEATVEPRSAVIVPIGRRPFAGNPRAPEDAFDDLGDLDEPALADAVGAERPRRGVIARLLRRR